MLLGFSCGDETLVARLSVEHRIVPELATRAAVIGRIRTDGMATSSAGGAFAAHGSPLSTIERRHFGRGRRSACASRRRPVRAGRAIRARAIRRLLMPGTEPAVRVAVAQAGCAADAGIADLAFDLDSSFGRCRRTRSTPLTRRQLVNCPLRSTLDRHHLDDSPSGCDRVSAERASAARRALGRGSGRTPSAKRRDDFGIERNRRVVGKLGLVKARRTRPGGTAEGAQRRSTQIGDRHRRHARACRERQLELAGGFQHHQTSDRARRDRSTSAAKPDAVAASRFVRRPHVKRLQPICDNVDADECTVPGMTVQLQMRSRHGGPGRLFGFDSELREAFYPRLVSEDQRGIEAPRPHRRHAKAQYDPRRHDSGQHTRQGASLYKRGSLTFSECDERSAMPSPPLGKGRNHQQRVGGRNTTPPRSAAGRAAAASGRSTAA